MFNAKETFHLKAECLTCKESNTPEAFQWHIISPVQQLLPTNSSRLVLAPNTLKPKTNYEFKVSLSGGKGFAQVNMFASKILHETCSWEPANGVEIFTEFTVTCTNSNPRNPLLYVLLQNDVRVTSSHYPVFTSKLNAKKKTEVMIENSCGQYLLVPIAVTIETPPIFKSIEEINEIFTTKNASLDLKRLIADESLGNTLVFINTVSTCLNEIQPTGHTKTVCSILDLMNELDISNFDDVSLIADSVKKLISVVTMDHSIAMKCGRILNKIAKVLKSPYEEISFSNYVQSTNQVLSVINQIIVPFDTFPPIQNVDTLISNEYHTEDYKDYGDLDVDIFEKLENLEMTTSSIHNIMSGLGIWSAKMLQPMEQLDNMETKDIQFITKTLDENDVRGTNLTTINGSTIQVIISDKLLAQYGDKYGISCSFFNKNPMWWYPDKNEINSDVVGVLIHEIIPELERNVSNKPVMEYGFWVQDSCTI